MFLIAQQIKIKVLLRKLKTSYLYLYLKILKVQSNYKPANYKVITK
ncbi:hypothetical protein PTRA_a3182 [Pseudoalteromonas translucida KMM 520]|uniref:Uncharacterized protein n=1 Tax=Pseudoalteromonas translucida KMM 520 TaxID=1315283 RepID=A0A0U2WLE8_9GAMM|nr:hypothetical protein PTRA_a3182 [Pseudoalteromonas translucida KMM 520]